MREIKLTPVSIIEGYKKGIFPMGDSLDNKMVFWCDPEKRAIIPIGKLHVSRSLRKEYIKRNLKFTVDSCFKNIIYKCADRDETWITLPIIQNYIELNKVGYAHSVEVWENKILIGGLYGVSIGAAFFAESMFSTQSNGSKFALIALMAILIKKNFLLLDVQFMTKHLKTMGAREISKLQFLKRLSAAQIKDTDFIRLEGSNLDLKTLNSLVLAN